MQCFLLQSQAKSTKLSFTHICAVQLPQHNPSLSYAVIHLFTIRSLMNMYPRYLNFSTCFISLPHLDRTWERSSRDHHYFCFGSVNFHFGVSALFKIIHRFTACWFSADRDKSSTKSRLEIFLAQFTSDDFILEDDEKNWWQHISLLMFTAYV